LETLAPDDRRALEWAHEHLEHPSLAVRLSSIVGTPIETALQLLPKEWYKRLHGAAESAIEKALDTAISSLRVKHDRQAHERYYHFLTIGTGALGGALGLPGLLLELPVTTSIMLRAIADIARSEGEELASVHTRMACLEVFALGGRTEADDAADTGYYGLRMALALPITTATHYVTRYGVQEGGPALVSVIASVAPRFGLQVSQKAAAFLIPLLGAAGGAAINAVFMEHFQDMARSHFLVRRLERRYGPDPVRGAYEDLD
jgi:hypothetical protein